MHAERKTTRPGKLLALLALPLALAMGAALFVVLSSDPTATDGPSPDDTEVVETGGEPAEEGSGSRRPRPTTGGADPAVAATVRGRLREYSTRDPVVGMELRLVAPESDEHPALELTASTDTDGTFRFAGLAPRGDYELAGVREPFAPVAMAGIELLPAETRDLGTIWLDVPVDLEVRVLDLSGAVVADAVVDVFATAGGAVEPAGAETQGDGEQAGLVTAGVAATPRPTGTATTDRRGLATVSGLLPGTYHVRAHADGHGRASRSGIVLAPDAATTPVRLLLSAAHSVSGTVVDAAGASVAEARVIAVPQSSRRPAADKVEATTAEDGSYRLEGLAPGIHTMYLARIDRPLLRAGTVRVPEMERWDISLRPTATIVGTVTGPDDAPVAGARVEYAPGGGLPLVTQTAEDGTYRLDDVPAGASQWFRVRADGFLPYPDPVAQQQGTGESLSEGAEVRRDVRLEAGASVTVTVRAADGSATIEGATVSLHMAQMWGNAGTPPTARTDEQGQAAFPGVVQGTFLVRIAAPGFVQHEMPQNWNALLQSPQAIPDAWRLEVNGETTVTYELAAGGRVEGVVLDAEDKPFAGALVTVSGAQPLVTVYSGEDGTFVVDAVPASRRATASASAPGSPGSESEPFVIAAGETVDGVEVRLIAGATITGRARSADGAPLEGAFARVVPGAMNGRNPWAFQRFENVGRHPVGADGSFSIPGMKNGAYTVRVDADGHVPAWDSTVKVEEGRDAAGVDLILETSGELSGRVLDPTGTPVAGADVTATYTGDGQRRQWGFVGALPGNPTAQTDADGRFTVRGLKTGNYRLWANATGFGGGSAEGVTIGSETVITLTATETISGIVKAADGAPLAGIPVQARNADNTRNTRRRNRWGRGGSQVFTGPDGTFEIRDLVSGVYDLTVSASSMWGRDVNVRDTTMRGVRSGRDDVEILVEAGAEISGRVLDVEDAPVTVGWVSAVAAAEGNRRGWNGNQRWARIGSDGGFRVSGLAPGSYVVRAQGSFLSDPLPGVAAGTQNVDIRVRSSGTISGWLVEGNGLSIDRGFNIQIRKSGTEDWGWGQIVQPGDGAFTLVALDGGAYDLKVQASPYAPVELRDVRVGREDLEIVLEQGREISGTVLDASGNPITANVQATQSDTQAGATATNGWARAGADGTFKLVGLIDAEYRLYVQARNHAPALIGPVRGGASGLRITMETGGTVAGTVTFEDGTPASGARLQLRDQGTERSLSWTRTDGEGAFRFNNVPTAGEWRLVGQVWMNGQRIDVNHEATISTGDEKVEVTLR